jgi:hypothetical protein
MDKVPNRVSGPAAEEWWLALETPPPKRIMLVVAYCNDRPQDF